MQELKRLRKERDWSQVRLAKESGIDRATINQVEGGHRSPTIETLQKLAAALEVELGDFFPKAEPSLFDNGEERRRRVKEAKAELLVEEGPFYSAFDALGVLLANRWRGSLKEFRGSPGIQIGTLKVGDWRALVQFTWDVFEMIATYETAAKEAEHPQHPGYETALKELHDVRREAANLVRPVVDHLKARQNTNAEFRRIWEMNDLEDLISKAESR